MRSDSNKDRKSNIKKTVENETQILMIDERMREILKNALRDEILSELWYLTSLYYD